MCSNELIEENATWAQLGINKKNVYISGQTWLMEWNLTRKKIAAYIFRFYLMSSAWQHLQTMYLLSVASGVAIYFPQVRDHMQTLWFLIASLNNVNYYRFVGNNSQTSIHTLSCTSSLPFKSGKFGWHRQSYHIESVCKTTLNRYTLSLDKHIRNLMLNALLTSCVNDNTFFLLCRLLFYLSMEKN